MQRTQIILEDWQYDTLKALAEKRGDSVSGVVREAVAAYLKPGERAAPSTLAGIEGIGRDAAASGRDHDRFLYPTRRRR